MGIIKLLEDIEPLQSEDFIINKMKNYGFDIQSIDADYDKLGSGFFSKVYKLEDKYALKTNKPLNWYIVKNEAEQYKKLVGKNFDNVVNVKYVNIFNSHKKVIIVMELLKKDEELKQLFSDANVIFQNEKRTVLRAFTRFYHKVYKRKQKLFNEVFKIFKQQILKGHLNDYTYDEDKVLLILQQVHSGMNELRSVGIEPNDIHKNNIMFDPETEQYKIVDFISQ